jgi:hypothetical protein
VNNWIAGPAVLHWSTIAVFSESDPIPRSPAPEKLLITRPAPIMGTVPCARPPDRAMPLRSGLRAVDTDEPRLDPRGFPIACCLEAGTVRERCLLSPQPVAATAASSTPTVAVRLLKANKLSIDIRPSVTPRVAVTNGRPRPYCVHALNASAATAGTRLGFRAVVMGVWVGDSDGDAAAVGGQDGSVHETRVVGCQEADNGGDLVGGRGVPGRRARG